MIIRKIDERISEEKLNYISFMNLTNLCNDSNIEYITELIKLFNESPTSLKDFEICFLVNYVIKGKVSSVKENDNEFVASMKRIAEYPELYDAVGEENQKIIDSIVRNDFGDKYDDIQIESKVVMI